jgi:hypothetical protein
MLSCYPSRMSAQAEWPFKDPKNTAVFSTVSVIARHEPVCRVCHDSDDGAWQFLPGGSVTMADAMVVSLSEVVSRDRTLLELADLPLGWVATRENAQSPWRRSQKTSD